MLYLLDGEGLLEGLTQQQLADVFRVKHRSTILRTLRSLDRFKAEYEAIRHQVAELHRENTRRRG